MSDHAKPFDPKTDPVDEMVVAKLEALADASLADLEQQREKYKERNRAAPDIALALAPYQTRWAEDAARASYARAKLERQRRERADALNTELLAANKEMAAASRDAARSSASAARWAKWAAIFTAIATGISVAQSLLLKH